MTAFKENTLLEELASADFPKVLEKYTEEEIIYNIAPQLDSLIDKDFGRLTLILYKIDVDENRIRKALSQADKNISSGQILARLIVNRQKQKYELRKQFS